jgi:hypothetical protein
MIAPDLQDEAVAFDARDRDLLVANGGKIEFWFQILSYPDNER